MALPAPAHPLLTSVLAAGAIALSLLDPQRPLASGGDDARRVPEFEIVDGDGQVVVRLASSHAGFGHIALQRPQEDGEPEIFAWVGSTFGSGSELVVSDPTGASKASLGLWIHGEPTHTRVTGAQSNGDGLFDFYGHAAIGRGLVVRAPSSGGEVLLSK